ncbi:MAG TPA: hypothetical protein PKC69_01380 [Chitinophagaceae bacterium]|nr:hypothetical protein [Chitinophagaceae bacterium]
MARIIPLPDQGSESALSDRTAPYDIFSQNAKATLGYSQPALNAYRQWYPLYEEIEKNIGSRKAYLFGFAICSTIGCSLCTAFFRKLIIEGGEDPEKLRLEGVEKLLFDFGSSIARYQGNIADHVYNQAADVFSKKDLVLLAAFAGQVIAANIFNNVVETDVDEGLSPYLPPVSSIWKMQTV